MTATWTTPRTWTTGEVVTASMLNAHVRDNLDWLKAHTDARGEVHGLASDEYLLSTKRGAYRIELGYAQVSSTGDGNYTASGSWYSAFGNAVWGIGMGVNSNYSGNDAGRNFAYIGAYSKTGFTVRLAEYGGGSMSCVIYVWGYGTDA
jgi:hypothetical protein